MQLNHKSALIKLLKFKYIDDFHIVQIVKRRKDNPSMTEQRVVLDRIFVDSPDKLEVMMSYIEKICDDNKARAYITVSPRNYEDVAKHTLHDITQKLINKHYKAVSKSFFSSCLKYPTSYGKHWILDFDDLNMEGPIEVMKVLKMHFNEQEPKIFKPYVMTRTPNGFHVVVKPFDVRILEVLKKKYKFEVHKNGMTLLYSNI